MFSPTFSLHLQILSVTSVLIALVGLFLIFELRTPQRGRQATQQVSTRQPGKSSLADLAPQVSRARHVAGESTDSQPMQNVMNAYGKLPMSFEENRGQTDPNVKFISRGSGYSLFLTTTQAVLALHKPSDTEGRNSSQPVTPTSSQRLDVAREAPKDSSSGDVLRMKLVGANHTGKIEASDELPSRSNYFIGNDPSKWRTNIFELCKGQTKERVSRRGCSLLRQSAAT